MAPSSSRMCIERLPWGNAARATRAVSGGTAVKGWGCSDIAILLAPLSEQKFLPSARDYIAVTLHHEFASGIKIAEEPISQYRNHRHPLGDVFTLGNFRFCQFTEILGGVLTDVAASYEAA